jgi:membrane-anchored protein YejM (alkaline phosphatase superfamily)
MGEDVVAIGLTWFATTHPVIAAAIAVVLLLLLVLIARWLWRGLRRLLARRRSAPAPPADV